MIVVPQPSHRLILHFFNQVKQLLYQLVIAYGLVEPLDAGILLCFSRPDVFNPDPGFTDPGQQRSTDLQLAIESLRIHLVSPPVGPNALPQQISRRPILAKRKWL